MNLDIKLLFDKYKIYLLVAFIYLLIALVRFGNITLNMLNTVPGANGDTFQNLWGVWWVSYAILHSHGIFYTNLLYWPIGSNLVYQTMSPISSLIAYPLESISLPFAYNSLFFLGFAIAGITMFILAEYLLKNRYAAFMAGIFFSFSSFHIAEAYAHLDWIAIGWVPLALYFFLKLLDGKSSLRNSLGLGASYVLVIFMGDIEQGAMVLLLFAIIFLVYLIRKRRAVNLSFVKALVLSAIIAFVLGSWGFIPILSTLGKPASFSIVNEYNNIAHNVLQSDDILSFFLPSFYGGLVPYSLFVKYYYIVFAPNRGSSVERTGYITYTVLFLAVIAIYKNSKAVRLWLVIALIFGLIALGPAIHLASTNIGIAGPFLLVRNLPILKIIGEPGRFGLIMFVALALVAAYGVLALLGILDKKVKYSRYVIVLLLMLIFIFETSGSPPTNGSIFNTTTVASIPKFYYLIRNMTGNFSVMQIPATQNPTGEVNLYTGEATYYTTASHKPILGGYLTRANYTENLYLDNIPLAVQMQNLESSGIPGYSSPLNENYTNQTLLVFYNYQTLFVVLNKNAYSSKEEPYAYSELYYVFGNPVYQDNSVTAFETANAIRNSLFRTFVEYPVVADWKSSAVYHYGNNTPLWYPLGEGSIAVYAPYPAYTNVSYDMQYNKSYTVNATISFYAVGLGSSNYLSIIEQAGLEKPVLVAKLDITQGLSAYTVRLTNLVSGRLGNSILFVSSKNSKYAQANNATDVLMGNITISKS